DYSKIEAEHLELESIPFDLPKVVHATATLLAVRAREKHLELTVDVPPDVPHMVRGDPTRVRQVLMNLIGNAIKFTEQGEVDVPSASQPSRPPPPRLRAGRYRSAVGGSSSWTTTRPTGASCATCWAPRAWRSTRRPARTRGSRRCAAPPQRAPPSTSPSSTLRCPIRTASSSPPPFAPIPISWLPSY